MQALWQGHRGRRPASPVTAAGTGMDCPAGARASAMIGATAAAGRTRAASSRPSHPFPVNSGVLCR